MHRTIRPIRDERGITTAEYAVGTAAGAGLAGLLYKMLTGGFGHVLGLLGIG
jgi:hypothetical protein